MKKVFLTGANGFIGKHTIPLLIKNGYEVHGVFHTDEPSVEPSVTKNPYLIWHQCNLLHTEEQKSLLTKIHPTHLLHFAWYTTHGKYWGACENFHWVQASLDLLINFADQGGKRAVLAGTCAEYDWSYGYCSEGVTPLSPATVYGVCKHSLQVMADAFTRRTGQTGLSSAWGRIFFLYGPHEHPNRLIPSVICSLLRGEPARCSHGRQIRDFLHVQDVADAFVTLLESDVSGPVNIASGYPIALKDIIRKIAEKLNRPDLIQLGAIAAAQNDPHILIADTDRLSCEAGWRPKYDLDTGLEQTTEWWRNRLFRGKNEPNK